MEKPPEATGQMPSQRSLSGRRVPDFCGAQPNRTVLVSRSPEQVSLRAMTPPVLVMTSELTGIGGNCGLAALCLCVKRLPEGYG